ncbi:MAG TPA: hypothetical protein DCR14_04620, partial [Acidimicrobiaceae bacterium]|nr:hypothetical protein [Acidimicrobiaceae bacterium]
MVTEGLGHTLFVEAGAGSGKTTALVGRVTNLVLSGVPIASIAAITFTEKAAAELRHRVRQQLTRAATGGDEPAERAQAARDALVDLDRAPIGTLHAFARRILGEFPVEAELPPRFTVLDEVQSATAFHERFTDFLEGLLDDVASARLVELCQYDKFGVERGVRRMADDFQANWDLVDERVGSTLPAPVDDVAWRSKLERACAAIAAFQAPPDDKQAEVPSEFARHATRVAAAPFGQLLRMAENWRTLTFARNNAAPEV